MNEIWEIEAFSFESIFNDVLDWGNFDILESFSLRFFNSKCKRLLFKDIMISDDRNEGTTT